MDQKFYDLLEANPVIAAVKDMGGGWMLAVPGKKLKSYLSFLEISVILAVLSGRLRRKKGSNGAYRFNHRTQWQRGSGRFY